MSEIVVQVNRSAGFKARAESDSKGLLGQLRPNKVEATENRQLSLRVSTGWITWDLRRALDMKPVVDNVVGPYAVASQ